MAVGQLIAGRYRLDEALGAGGMGEVWRATDLELRRVVALKRSQQGDSGQIRREARIGAGLHHPNVVTVFDAVLDAADRWLVMEYLPSRSLDAVLKGSGRLTPAQTARMIAQVAAALVAMHAKGMLHRDIKPGNVLVAEDGTAKLTDLGISRWVEVTHTHEAQFAGTPGYLAPEVATGQAAGPPADVFALGATLYAALVGHSPWGRPEQGPWAQRHRAVEYQLEPLPDNAFAPVLAALLARDPAHRPSAAQAYQRLAAIATELTGQQLPAPVGLAADAPGAATVTPPPSPAASRPRRVATRRSRRVALGALALALVLAAVAGVVLTSTSTHTEAGTAVPAVIWPGMVSDPLTMDACAVLDPDSLVAFGTVQMNRDVEELSKCGMLLSPANDKKALVGVVAEFHVWSDQVRLPRTPGKLTGPLSVASDEGLCRLVFGLSGTYQLTMTSNNIHGSSDLCGILSRAAGVTAVRLGRGLVPELPPKLRHPANSLARADACTLLDNAELRAELGYTPLGEPDFGDWTCSWGKDTDANAAVVFTRAWPLADPDPDIGFGSPPTKVNGRDYYESTNTDTCSVQFVHREYPADNPPDGSPATRDEIVQVYLSKPNTSDPKKLCPGAENLMTAIIPRLPR